MRGSRWQSERHGTRWWNSCYASITTPHTCGPSHGTSAPRVRRASFRLRRTARPPSRRQRGNSPAEGLLLRRLSRRARRLGGIATEVRLQDLHLVALPQALRIRNLVRSRSLARQSPLFRLTLRRLSGRTDFARQNVRNEVARTFDFGTNVRGQLVCLSAQDLSQKIRWHALRRTARDGERRRKARIRRLLQQSSHLLLARLARQLRGFLSFQPLADRP